MKHSSPVGAAVLVAALTSSIAREAVLAVAATLAPGLALATPLAVTSVAAWPGSTVADEPPAHAVDGNTQTYVALHGAGDTSGVAYLALGFDRAPVNRIRLWKRAPGERNLAIQYTTEAGALEQRTWRHVKHLSTGYDGEFVHSTAVNADGTIEGDDHDSPPIPDGGGHLWASLTFDTVMATGLRLEFVDARTSPADRSRASCDAHEAAEACTAYRVAEFQAHYDAPPDRAAPHTVATVSPLPNPAGWSNTSVTVTLRATDDPDGSGVHHIAYSTVGAQTTPRTVATGAQAVVPVTVEGATTLSYAATDHAGNEEAVQWLTVKVDRTDPVIVGLPAHCTLWPANGRMTSVARVMAADALSGPGSFTVSVTSNERPRGPRQDIALSGVPPAPTAVRLRAESDARGAGRVYTITVVANDLADNSTVAMTTCTVPRAVDD